MRVESIWIPLRFILSALAALIVGISMIAARPDILATYHYNQWVLAATHVFTLGWISSVIMGAMYQLVPVALETKLYSPRLASAQFWIHLVGWSGMVTLFWISDFKHVSWFGAIVALGVLLFVYNMVCSLRRMPSWNAIAFGVASALMWLSATMVAGIYIALTKIAGPGPFDPIAQMHAHAHLGAVGFFMMMLVAISYKLVPMFTLSEIRNSRRVWLSLWLLNIGLAAVVVAITFQSRWKWVAALVLAFAFILYGMEISAILRARQRRKLELPVKQFLFGLALIAPLVAVGIVLAVPGLPATQFTAQLENLYGLLALAGVLSPCIIGMLYKILPFLVWYCTYSRHIGRSQVPSLADLSRGGLQQAGFATFVPALAGLCGGSLCSSELAVRWSALLLLGSLGFFIANAVVILAHLWRPRLQPLLRVAPKVKPSTI